MAIRLFQPQPRAGSAERLGPHEQKRLRAAALRALYLYPGCLGELAFRELTAYADFGYRFAGECLITRLATEVLATLAAPHAGGQATAPDAAACRPEYPPAPYPDPPASSASP